MTTPVNVIFVIDCLYADAGGGSERQFLKFYQHAPDYGISIHVCFLQHQEIHDKIDWIIEPLTLNIGSPYSIHAFQQAKKLSKYIDDNNISLVQTLFDNAGRFSSLLHLFISRKKVKTIIGLRNSGHNHKGFLRIELKVAYKLADHFIVNAEFIKNYISNSYNVSSKTISVIKNTYEPPAPVLNVEAKNLKLELKKKFDYVGVIVANLRPIKGIDDLLLAIKFLVEKEGAPSIAFLLLGEGEQEIHYRNMASELNINGHTFFLGRQDNVSSYLKISDFALLTSHAEGLSNALIEYVFSELPVIATDVGGNSEVIEHEIHGLIAAPNSPEEISQAVLQLTGNLKQFKHNAITEKVNAESTYAPRTIYQSTALLYQALVVNGNGK